MLYNYIRCLDILGMVSKMDSVRLCAVLISMWSKSNSLCCCVFSFLYRHNYVYTYPFLRFGVDCTSLVLRGWEYLFFYPQNLLGRLRHALLAQFVWIKSLI